MTSPIQSVPLGDLRRIRTLRSKARNDFHAFCEFVYLSLLGNRVPARFHLTLAERLQEFIERPGGGILCIAQPPGTAKTTFLRLLLIWLMGRRPGISLGYVANSEDLCVKSGRFMRDNIATPRYNILFPDTRISASAASTTNFETTDGSRFGAASVGSKLYGARFDLICIDDPIGSFEEAQSESQLAKLHDAYENMISNRLSGDEGKIIVISQRLAENDLTGYLLRRHAGNPDSRPVELLSFPMVATGDPDDPLGRAEGELLWPERFGWPSVRDAMVNPFTFDALYQQRPPNADMSFCGPQDITFAPTPLDIDRSNDYRILIGCDVAISEGRNDYTVIAVVAMHRPTGKLHIVDMYRDRVDHAVSVERLLDMIEKHSPNWVGIEDDPGSKAFMSHLRTRAAYRSVGIGTMEMVRIAGRDKETRAGALKSKIKCGFLHIDKAMRGWGEIVAELYRFPNAGANGHDDIVDALAVAVSRPSNMVISKPSEEKKKPVIPLNHTAPLNEMWDEHERGGDGRRQRI